MSSAFPRCLLDYLRPAIVACDFDPDDVLENMHTSFTANAPIYVCYQTYIEPLGEGLEWLALAPDIPVPNSVPRGNVQYVLPDDGDEDSFTLSKDGVTVTGLVNCDSETDLGEVEVTFSAEVPAQLFDDNKEWFLARRDIHL